jgi:glutaredoxin
MSTNLFQAQAPICPYCHDDHSTLVNCKFIDLKKELLSIKLEQFFNTCRDEKQDGSLWKVIKDMVAYY